jgi:hypothetical protein
MIRGGARNGSRAVRVDRGGGDAAEGETEKRRIKESEEVTRKKVPETCIS